MKNTNPFCSVIVLNYFGEKVIGNTIESLLRLDYPGEKIEIIIVDNNSQDKSREIILDYAKRKNIKYLFLDKNKGFAGGNNQGLRIAKGEFIALLNNDCVVENNWLSELVKTAQKDPKIFAVSSKIKLYPKYHNLNFRYNNNLFLERIYLSGSNFSDLEKHKKLLLDAKDGDGAYIIEVPFAPNDQIISLEIAFEVGQNNLLKSAEELFTLLNEDGVVNGPIISINKNRLSVDIKFDVRKFDVKNIYERIQNAGIVVFQDGSGRDIGAKIFEQRQYYERDYGQYSEEQEVYAACGAAVLFNKMVLDRFGYLDESFFMYYEDVEISERARLNGYKIYYCPKAEVRHLHAYSSKELSNFFIYHAEKGRLLHTFYNFPFHIFMKEYLTMILRIGEVGLRITKGLSDRQRVMKFIKNIIAYARKSTELEGNDKTDFGKVIQYFKIIFYFVICFPWLMFKKYMKQIHMSKYAITDNYQDIVNGKWYF